MPTLQQILSLGSASLSALTAALPGSLSAFESPPPTNPIAKIARIFDSQLVQAEDRVSWLESRIATFARHREHTMKFDLGFRGCRSQVGSPDPFVTIDLGSVRPIDSIFLVPTQKEFLEDTGIFPRQYTLELSNSENFSQRTLVFSTDTTTPLPLDGNPVPFKTHNSARFVRLTVHQGHPRGRIDVFGLSEIAVISRGEATSFNSTVTYSGGDMHVPKLWNTNALIDGRTPCGVWQNGNDAGRETGDFLQVMTPDEQVSWSIEFNQTAPLDRVVLFPYQLSSAFESLILSDSLAVYLKKPDGTEEELAYQWENPILGSNSMTPLVIPLNGKVANSLRITGVRPNVMGDLKIHALSEIEAWSQGINIAKGLTVTRNHGGHLSQITSLTNGFTSEKRIAPYGMWLDQLAERGKIERELVALRPRQQRQATESELNATWGSAMILGLTFLIPVFVVERRRLMSREQLDFIRKRIASDLHDDIGSNLGSISLIARSARKDLVRLHGPEEVAHDLDEVESIARESSLAMRDIVWLLERRQDSIGDLVDRMRETAGRLLREIDHTVECNSQKTAGKLSLDAKRHLFLFYKEAIHNVLKHSKADTVSIRLWDDDDKLALEILDNGIGLPSGDVTEHATVRKLEDRARVLGGLLQIISSKETGTQIRLLVKRSHLNANPTTA